jgi:hypothetical protein
MTDTEYGAHTRARLADIEARIEALELRVRAQPPSHGARQKTATFDPDAWQKTLQTPGGVAAVASAFATHIRETFAARRPRGLDLNDLHERTSVTKLVEVLEASSARLREFQPVGAADVDLSPLGSRPFRTESKASTSRSCSFCGKAQNEVTKLIAGPTVLICNECIDVCNSIVSET